MPTRRTVGLWLGATFVGLGTKALGQQAQPVIGFLSSRSPEESVEVLAALRDGLKATGFNDGSNIRIEFRWAFGHYERVPALAVDLARRQVAVIIAAGGNVSAVAARAATSTIPIVFTGSDNPVEIGLIASLARPGGNITGVSLFTSDLEAKRFALLRELAPQARLIAMLINPKNPSAERDMRDVQDAANAVSQAVLFVRASSEIELDAAFDTIVEHKSDALLVGHDPYFNSRREQIVALAARHKMPTIYEFREFVLAGGLMSYGSRLTENYHLAGTYAGRILKGANPGGLPVVQPSKFELVLNQRTAKALGLTIPPTLLARADEVIE
jgi:putative ABC transport system substrate-binding protein